MQSTTSEQSTDTMQTLSAVTNIKQEIMATLQQEIMQLLMTDIKNIQTKLSSIKQTISSHTDQTKQDVLTFQHQLKASNNHFQQQMTNMIQNFEQQLQAQQAQKMAFFQQFSYQNIQQQPPPVQSGGSTY